MSLMMSSGVQVNLLSGLHSIKHEDCISMCCYGDLYQVYIKLFSFKGLRKWAALVLNDSESKVGGKLEMLLYSVVVKFLKNPEEFRMQYSL